MKNELSPGWHSKVLYGVDLVRFAGPAKGLCTREIFSRLTDYIYSPVNDRVCILYGLRRTGKTTMIRQAILQMDEEHRKKTALLQITSGTAMAGVNQDLKRLEDAGFRYIFIDEVTLPDDFLQGCAILADIYAASGMKIILSGADSLIFHLAKNEQLYDRCIMVHTTFIPYRESECVLGMKGIDEYIRRGGTMSPCGNTFSTEQSTKEYIDSAISKNIQHSLKNDQDGGHEKDELTGAVGRVIEDMNQRFAASVLTDVFRSHDPGQLRSLLEITPERVRQIQECLRLLDLIDTVNVVNDENVNQSRKRVIFTQPWLRYEQASTLVTALLQDEMFRDPGIRERVLDEIRGRMMKDIILLETKKARPDLQVFVLQFAEGEFDMVTADPRALTCSIFEIRHSKEPAAEEAGHLKDEDKCARTEKQYGDIEGKYVIYRGSAFKAGDIQYLNVEEHLKSFGDGRYKSHE